MPTVCAKSFLSKFNIAAFVLWCVEDSQMSSPLKRRKDGHVIVMS